MGLELALRDTLRSQIDSKITLTVRLNSAHEMLDELVEETGAGENIKGLIDGIKNYVNSAPKERIKEYEDFLNNLYAAHEQKNYSKLKKELHIQSSGINPKNLLFMALFSFLWVRFLFAMVSLFHKDEEFQSTAFPASLATAVIALFIELNGKLSIPREQKTRELRCVTFFQSHLEPDVQTEATQHNLTS